MSASSGDSSDLESPGSTKWAQMKQLSVAIIEFLSHVNLKIRTEIWGDIFPFKMLKYQSLHTSNSGEKADFCLGTMDLNM